MPCENHDIDGYTEDQQNTMVTPDMVVTFGKEREAYAETYTFTMQAFHTPSGSIDDTSHTVESYSYHCRAIYEGDIPNRSEHRHINTLDSLARHLGGKKVGTIYHTGICSSYPAEERTTGSWVHNGRRHHITMISSEPYRFVSDLHDWLAGSKRWADSPVTIHDIREPISFEQATRLETNLPKGGYYCERRCNFYSCREDTNPFRRCKGELILDAKPTEFMVRETQGETDTAYHTSIARQNRTHMVSAFSEGKSVPDKILPAGSSLIQPTERAAQDRMAKRLSKIEHTMSDMRDSIADIHKLLKQQVSQQKPPHTNIVSQRLSDLNDSQVEAETRTKRVVRFQEKDEEGPRRQHVGTLQQNARSTSTVHDRDMQVDSSHKHGSKPSKSSKSSWWRRGRP